MAIIDRFFSKKMNRLRAQFLDLATKMHQDAAIYLQSKITEEILNGPPGSDYPKTGYPAGVSAGASGFVGVVSGNLRRSIQPQPVDPFRSHVGIDGGAAAIGVSSPGYRNYAEIVAKWSKEKYGMNYFEITASIHGEFIKEKMREEIRRLLKAISKNQPYRYSNPFPG